VSDATGAGARMTDAPTGAPAGPATAAARKQVGRDETVRRLAEPLTVGAVPKVAATTVGVGASLPAGTPPPATPDGATAVTAPAAALPALTASVGLERSARPPSPSTATGTRAGG
jgi:hypothetical protein